MEYSQPRTRVLLGPNSLVELIQFKTTNLEKDEHINDKLLIAIDTVVTKKQWQIKILEVA